MYNKLFTKILDSSIWLQSDQTVRVWITLLAAMDEDGFTPFATVANLANRAHVSLEATRAAVAYLEGPDECSGNPANDGRRIERVDGGWLVLNAAAHREMVTRSEIKRRQRERAQASRDRKRHSEPVTDALQIEPCHSCHSKTAMCHSKTGVCHRKTGTCHSKTAICHASVTESEAVAVSEAEAVATAERSVLARSSDHAETGGSPTGDRKYEEAFRTFWTVYPRKTAKAVAAKAYAALRPSADLQAVILAAVRQQAASHDWQKDGGRFVPHAATWLRGRRWEDVPVGMVPASTVSADPSASVESAEDREHRLLQERTQVYIAEQKRLEAETKAWRESPDYVPLRELFRRQREAQGLPPLAFLDEAKP